MNQYVNKSNEPEFQLQKEMETEFNNSYGSMLVNMGKVLLTEVQQKLKQNARSTKQSSSTKES